MEIEVLQTFSVSAVDKWEPLCSVCTRLVDMANYMCGIRKL